MPIFAIRHSVQNAQAHRAAARRVTSGGVALALLLSAATCVATSLTISGLDKAEERAVTEALPVPACIERRWQLRELARQVQTQIRTQRRARGDYRPQVDIVRNLEPPCFGVAVNVTPGKPVTIRERNLLIEGDPAARQVLEPLTQNKGMRAGDVFVESNWEGLKDSLGARALDLGYFDARIASSRAEVFLDADAVDLSLNFDSGVRYSIGELRFELSGRKLDDALVRRFVTITPGSPWETHDIAETRSALLGSGYFGDIMVTPDLDAAHDAQMPVVIALETVQRFEVSAGAGYATDIGPRLNAEFSDRLVNRWGHRYDLRGIAALRNSEIHAGYRLPAADRRSWWAFDIGAGRSVTRSSRDEEIRGGVRYITQLSSNWQRTLLLDASHSLFDVGPDNLSATLIVPGVRWEFERTDEDDRLPQGLSFSTEVHAAAQAILSETSFTQTFATTRWTRRLGERTRTAVRLDLGGTVASDFRRLPPDYRFFAGGDDSVRGFDRDQLGPTDAGQAVGGRFLLAGSVELERLIRGRWGVAVFTDAGQAFSALPFELQFASGVGLRWFSPVGSLRLDVGVPWQGGPPRLHIGLGRTL